MNASDPIPLLLVSNYLPSSNGSRAISEDLGLRLRHAGWPVLLTSRRVNKAARLADMLHTAWHARDRYDAAIVDVYSGFAFFWSESVCRMLRWLGKPYVLTLHGGNLPVFSKTRGARVGRLLAGAAAVTAPSAYLLETMRAWRPDLRLIPNPLSLGAYRFRMRNQLRPRLLWLRAFHRIYNPSLAPRALAQLRAVRPDAELWMAGPDKGDGSLELARQTARELGVEAAVHFLPSVPKAEVPGWLEQGDIFLNTTDVDNTPVSVLEAMACGLCVVSTEVGGIPYLLGHERDALLVPAGDAAAMAGAAARLLADPVLAQRLSAAGRRSVEEFDWNRVLPQWQELLHTVALRNDSLLAGVA